MKKLFLTLMALGFSSSVFGFDLPTDRNGIPARTIQDIGVNVYLATSNVARLLTGGTTSYGAQGSSIAIFGVLTSTPVGTWQNSIAAPCYLEIRSTDRANTTTELLIPPIKVGGFISTGSLLLQGALSPVPKNLFYRFSPPVIAPDLVSVNLTSAPADFLGKWFSAAVFYRIIGTNTPEDVWFPQDSEQGIAPFDPDLYGVMASTGVRAGGVAGDNIGADGADWRNAGTYYRKTSTVPAEQSGMFLYGWSASSGSLTEFFTIKDTTGNITGVAGEVAGTPALPEIYPRSLNLIEGQGTESFSQFNFPWPVIFKKGVAITYNYANNAFRFYTRSRRGLRNP